MQRILPNADPFPYADLREFAESQFLLALDSLQDPQNFGTLLRTVGYLVALDSTTLAPLARVRLKDPSSGQDARPNRLPGDRLRLWLWKLPSVFLDSCFLPPNRLLRS